MEEELGGSAEVERKQPEWDSQISALGRRETELHQSQLRLIREQTTTFIRDLANLQHEVATIKAKQDAAHADLATAFNSRAEELREAAGRERRDRDLAHTALHARIGTFEQDVPSQREELGTLRAQVIAFESRMLPYVDELKTAFQRDIVERTSAQVQLERNCSDLAGILTRHALVHQDIESQLSGFKAAAEQDREASYQRVVDHIAKHAKTMTDLRAVLEEERELHENHRSDSVARLVALEEECVKVGALGVDLASLGLIFKGEEAAREEHFKRRCANDKEGRERHMITIEDALKERLTASLKLQFADDRATFQVSLQCLEATMAARLESIERNVGAVVGTQGRDIEVAKTRMDLVQERISDHHAQLGQQTTIQEKVDYLEKLLGDSADKQNGDLEVASGNLDKLHVRMSACEKHSAELQKAHGGHEAKHASMAQRLEYLEQALGDATDRHGAELEAVRDAHAQHEAVQLKHEKEFEGIRAAQAVQAPLADRVSRLEGGLQDLAGDAAEQLAGSRERLAELHGRLMDCEGHGLVLAELRKAHAGFLGERGQRDKAHDALKDQVDSLDTRLGDATAHHGSTLQDANAKLEQLQGRLAACERYGTALGDLRKVHGALCNDKAALDVEVADFRDRLSIMENVIGEHVQGHTMEIEALKSAHGKQGKAIETATRTHQTQHAAVIDRFDYLERCLSDSADKHEEALVSASTKLERMHARIASCEAHGLALSDLRKAHGSLSDDKTRLETNHAFVAERLERLERQCDEVTEAHQGALQESRAKVEQLQNRLAACEKQGAVLGDLRKSHAILATEKSALDALHAALRERVDSLAAQVGDVADSHTRELEALKDAHGRQTKSLVVLRAGHSQNVALPERLANLESSVGNASDRHREELAQQRTRLDEFHGRVATCEATGSVLGDLKKAHQGLASEKATLESSHATLRERVDYLETMLGSSADQQTKVLDNAHNKLEQLQSRLTKCESQTAALPELERAQASIARDKATQDQRFTLLREEVFELGGRLRDVGGQHSKELETIKTSHGKHAKALDSLRADNASHATLLERVSEVERRLGNAVDKYSTELSTAQDEVLRIRGQLAACEGQGAAQGATLAELKKVHAALASEKATLVTHQGSLDDRVEHLEGVLADSEARFVKHQQDLEASKIAHVNFVAEAKARDKIHGAVADRLAELVREQEETNLQHATLLERIGALEAAVGESADNFVREHELLKASHEKQGKDLEATKKNHQQHAASLTERFESLEKLSRDTADRHAKALTEAHAKLQDVSDQVADECQARETQRDALKDHWSSEREAAETRHLALAQRLQHLEAVLEDEVQRQTKELHGAKVQHAKLANEARASIAQQTTLLERLEVVEKDVTEGTTQREEKLRTAQSKLEQSLARLSSSCEAHAAALADLEKAHSSLESERATHESDQAAIKERVDGLASAIADASERHDRALEAARTAGARTAAEARQRDAHHASVAERVDYVEKLFGEAADRQTEDLRAQGANLEDVQGRLVACEAHQGQQSEELRRARAALQEETTAKFTTLTAQLVGLECAVSESADRTGVLPGEVCQRLRDMRGQLEARLDDLRLAGLGHAQALEELRASLPEGRGLERVAAEVAQLAAVGEAQKAALEERLNAVEIQLGDAAARHVDQVDTRRAQLASDRQAVKSRPDEGADLSQGSAALLEERLDRLESQVQNTAARDLQGLQAQHGLFCGRLVAVEERLADEDSRATATVVERRFKAAIEDLREEVGRERQMRSHHQDLVAQQVEAQRGEREAHAQAMSGVVDQRRSHDVQMRVLEEQFAVQRTNRERLEVQVQELQARQREAAAERSALLQGRGEDGRAMRELEEGLSERILTLQRMVTTSDSLLRREIEDRLKDSRRLWDALDNHSHDPSTQVLDLELKSRNEVRRRPRMQHPFPLATKASEADFVEEREEEPDPDEPEVTDDHYLPFPCQPLTSFLRLGGTGLGGLSESEEPLRVPRGDSLGAAAARASSRRRR